MSISLHSPNRKPSDLNELPALPRELIDSIITLHIRSHDDDPVYQWTVLRNITYFHRKKIDSHFRAFWLPKLSIALYLASCSTLHIKYALSDNPIPGNEQESEQNRDYMARFDAQGDLPENHCHSLATRDKKGLMRLGEGVLNDGHEKGGIVSDADIPNLEEYEGGRIITLDWKGLFSNIFTEEALMRGVTEKLVGQLHYRVSLLKACVLTRSDCSLHGKTERGASNPVHSCSST